MDPVGVINKYVEGEHIIRTEPAGVVGFLAAWNFPVTLPGSYISTARSHIIRLYRC